MKPEQDVERLTADFFDQLAVLYIRAGEPPLRTLAKLSPRLSASNLSELLNGRRTALPGYDVLTEVVKALMHGRPEPEVRQELELWHERRVRIRTEQRVSDRTGRGAGEREPQARATVEDVTTVAGAEAERIVTEAREQAVDLVRQLLANAQVEADELVQAARAKAELLGERVQDLRNQVQHTDSPSASAGEEIATRVQEDAASIVIQGHGDAESTARSAVIGIRAHPHFNAQRFRQRVAAAGNTVLVLDTSSQVILADPARQFRFREALRKAVAPTSPGSPTWPPRTA